MSNPLSAAEAKELIRLWEISRLYEVEAWIRAGRSSTVPGEVRETPLGVATSTGFHSPVELLLRHEEDQKVKNGALRLALIEDLELQAKAGGTDHQGLGLMPMDRTASLNTRDAVLFTGLATPNPLEARVYLTSRADTTIMLCQ